jgi:hypothetical protein
MPAAVLTLDTGGSAELVRGVATTLTVTPWAEDGTSPTPGAWSAGLWLDEVQLASTSGTGAVSWTITPPSTYALRDDYQVRWAITVAGVQHHVRQAAMVCRSVVRPTLTPADIYLRMPALDPASEAPLTVFASGKSVMTVAAAAWREVLEDLAQRAFRPHMIITPEALAPVHLALTLQRLCEMLASTMDGGPYLELADRFRDETSERWKKVTIKVAPDTQTEGRAQRMRAAPLIGGAFGQGVNRYPGEPGRGRGSGVL